MFPLDYNRSIPFYPEIISPCIVAPTPIDNNLDDDLDLPVESSCTTLNQGNICRQAHPVNMSSSIEIVERIEDEIESLEPVDIEFGVFDIGMMRFKFDVRIEFGGCFFRDLKRMS